MACRESFLVMIPTVSSGSKAKGVQTFTPWSERSTVEAWCSTLKSSDSTRSLMEIVAHIRCDRRRSAGDTARIGCFSSLSLQSGWIETNAAGIRSATANPPRTPSPLPRQRVRIGLGWATQMGHFHWLQTFKNSSPATYPALISNARAHTTRAVIRSSEPAPGNITTLSPGESGKFIRILIPWSDPSIVKALCCLW